MSAAGRSQPQASAADHLDPPGQDRIRLVGLTARGHHGVYEHERREGQDFSVDVTLYLDTRRAALGDELAATVDYGSLAVAVADMIRGEPVNLLETLADRVARRCLEDPLVEAVDVAVHKPQAPVPETFGDVVVAIHRRRAEVAIRPEQLEIVPDGEMPAVLALGSNLGDREATLASAVADLGAAPGIRLRTVSAVVETAPVGGPPQPDYLNAVALVSTRLSPVQLLAAVQRIEAAHGRRRGPESGEVRWGPRSLDIDVISYGSVVARSDRLELPHPRAALRAFVLDPWLRADPAATLPAPGEPRPIARLLPLAADRAGVYLRADLTLRPSGPPIDEEEE